MFTNKQTTIAAAQARYGYIDISTGHWPDQSKWIQLLAVPAGMFPNWKVLNTQIPVSHIACNINIHVRLMSALSAIALAGLADKLLTFDGCFNIRLVRGSAVAISCHSYGLALDLNAAQNYLGMMAGGFYDDPALVKCFTDQGFDWGGDFKTRKDPMHFSYGWE